MAHSKDFSLKRLYYAAAIIVCFCVLIAACFPELDSLVQRLRGRSHIEVGRITTDVPFSWAAWIDNPNYAALVKHGRFFRRGAGIYISSYYSDSPEIVSELEIVERDWLTKHGDVQKIEIHSQIPGTKCLEARQGNKVYISCFSDVFQSNYEGPLKERDSALAIISNFRRKN